MKKAEITGIGYSVSGFEENYIVFVDNRIVGASSILEEVGIKSISPLEEFAFENISDPKWGLDAELYRTVTNNKYPPLYKIKLTVEAKPVSKEETQLYWLAKAIEYINYAKQYEPGPDGEA